MSIRRVVLPALLAICGVAIPASQQACSIVVIDSDAKQCSTDDDCRARGASFADSFCSAEHTCVRAVDYCATNAECIDRSGIEASICRKDTHKCVALTNAQCTLLADKNDLRNDDVVVMGVHGIPSWAPATKSCENSIELARRDFAQNAGGLPPNQTSKGNKRPVVWVSCDVPIGDQAKHVDVTEHLFKDVGVVQTIGPFATIDMTQYGVRRSIESGSGMFTVSEDQPAYDLPGRAGLVFGYGLPIGGVVDVQVRGVDMLEKLMKSRGINKELRLAYVYVTGIGLDDAGAFARKMQLNGKSAEQNGENVKQFNYGSPSDADFVSKISSTAAAVGAFKPDIVVLRGSDEVAAVATQIESVYPNTAYYLLPVEARNGAVGFVGGREDLRRRTLGWGPGAWDRHPQTIELMTRYRGTPDFEATPGPLTRGCYSQAYTLYFAAAAVPPDQPLNGRTLGAALFNRFSLDNALEVEMKPSSILKAYTALQAGQNLKVVGPGGLVGVYEPATGFLKDWYAHFWCVAPNDNTDPAVTAAIEGGLLQLNIIYSGLRGTTTGEIGPNMPQNCLK